jgi:hypothetical protein
MGRDFPIKKLSKAIPLGVECIQGRGAVQTKSEDCRTGQPEVDRPDLVDAETLL